MTLITKQDELTAKCAEFKKAAYVTVDTEFLRDKTYYPKLCLIQICAPGEQPVAIDPLEENIDLDPVRDLLCDQSIVKVFHAGRQDLEIFYNLFECIPAPIFDTQVAAMVCGYGDSAGYQRLVQEICNTQLDKAHQFTNWQYRPLTDKQLAYALDDVTYLRDIYENLEAELKQRGRSKWLDEEMAILSDPDTYENPPEKAWERLKLKNTKPKTLAAARALADWREREAIRKNIPRTWVLKDDTLVDLAQRGASTPKDLERIRNFPTGRADSTLVKSILSVLKEAKGFEKSEIPAKPETIFLNTDDAPAFEMLKMLLKIKAAENDVAARMIASQDDLKRLAGQDAPDIPALKGWRHEIFGADALDLKAGRIALSLNNGEISVSRL